jgi:hypothetical protein
MAEFLVELYIPSAQLPAVQGWIEAATTAAADVSREGEAVRCVRSIVVPEDETCFLLYEAPSIDAVRAAAERAGLGSGRITETLSEAEEERP